jgi:hypothetical protein
METPAIKHPHESKIGAYDQDHDNERKTTTFHPEIAYEMAEIAFSHN